MQHVQEDHLDATATSSTAASAASGNANANSEAPRQRGEQQRQSSGDLGFYAVDFAESKPEVDSWCLHFPFVVSGRLHCVMTQQGHNAVTLLSLLLVLLEFPFFLCLFFAWPYLLRVNGAPLCHGVC